VDWFENINELGYWWQTAHESGMCFALGSAKRCVEQALWEEHAAKAARYAAGEHRFNEAIQEGA
jgi:nitric oxide synthase oxygenase domain/subunit